jgi:hypothetical protein
LTINSIEEYISRLMVLILIATKARQNTTYIAKSLVTCLSIEYGYIDYNILSTIPRQLDSQVFKQFLKINSLDIFIR